jgi:dihydroneopterin aldolase
MSLPATILVDGLELHAFHGWHAHEGAFGQHFAVDLELSVDIARAAESDQLADALDYGAVIAAARVLFVERRHKLLEAAAVALGRGLLAQFPTIEVVRVRVKKLAPPVPEKLNFAGVDVRIARGETSRGG